MEKIYLPPSNGLTGLSTNNRKEYAMWRKSNGYRLWLKKQWKRQNGNCYYCNESLLGKKHNVEHVVPQHINTTVVNMARNLVLSCPNCNKKKGRKNLGKKRNTQARKFNKTR